MKPQVPTGEPDVASTAEAKRGSGERTDDQHRGEREEVERRRRLADMRASLSDEGLAMLGHRAEEALAADGVARTCLGYEVLVKLKVDELLEREDLSADVSASQGDPHAAAVEPRINWAMGIGCTGSIRK
jgi:hypothetical protein